jgi:hypothetical protein
LIAKTVLASDARKPDAPDGRAQSPMVSFFKNLLLQGLSYGKRRPDSQRITRNLGGNLKTLIYCFFGFALACASIGKARADTQPLFEDTFAAADPSLVLDAGTQVKDGKMAIALSANFWVRYLYQVGYFTDADLSLSFSNVAGDSLAGSEAGIVFWAIDNSNFYVACVQADSSCNIFRYSAARWLTPASIPASATVHKGTGTSNLLRVVTKGNRATFYVNGTQVTAITGMPPAGGGLVGIYAQSDTVPATWSAQDFKVMPLQ